VNDIISQLKTLKLYGMADCYADIQSNHLSPHLSGTGEFQDATTCLLQQLLKAEAADRSIRTIRYQMKSAKFPIQG
jgi:hypothetical protein